ncbi:MAG TPA: glucuronate isomerase, partial [Clostridia bacterium]|nr:glucuronate isomerase [Clostridia bacterium]
MKTFIQDNFMLQNETARELYHTYAKEMPIFDFHCHLPPKEIAENSKYRSLTEVWLGGDHYKWRAMRSEGIEEERITGGAKDWEKFKAWASTIQHAVGNPLYHWTHLELRKPFGIDDLLLDGTTAAQAWDRTGELLAKPEFSARGIMQ